MVVFSPHDRPDNGLSAERARMAALRLAGLAPVYSLQRDGERAFQELMGIDLGVWSGASRVYLPGITFENPDPRPHRYFLSRRLGSTPIDAGLTVARYLSVRMARQRAPRSYVRLRSVLDTDLESQLDDLFAEIERLEADNDQRLEDYLTATSEADELATQLGLLQQQVCSTWAAIHAAGAQESVLAQLSGDTPQNAVATPDPPDACTEVAELARQHLPGVTFPPEACEDLGRLDDHLEGPKWAKAAWRGLVALDAYAQVASNFDGGFYEWCNSSGSPLMAAKNEACQVESTQFAKGSPARSSPVDSTLIHQRTV